MWNWMQGYGAQSYGMHGWWMWLWPLLLLGVVVWLVSLSVQAARRTEKSAEDLLRRRYAAGEIDETEFRRRREHLRHA